MYKVNYIHLRDDTTFKLKIIDYKIDGNQLSLDFDSDVIGKYYFESLKEKESFNKTFSLGDTLSLKGTLEIPKNNTTPNTFNYKEYLKYKKINYILKIDSFKVYSSNKNIFLKIKNYLYKRIYNIKYNDYLYAFILGKSSYLDEEEYENYKINGVTHLFALSGLHVSIFSLILLNIMKRLKLKEKLSFIITSLFLLFFSFVASYTPSILRAVIFFILSSINKIYYFHIKPINILYLTFIILVVINPFYIFNTGFILSFTITFFILLFNEYNSVKSGLKSILIISLLSFFSSLPIIINMSYEINIISSINNIFFIPFVTNIVFPVSIISVIFPKISYVLNILTTFMEYVSNVSSNIVNITIYFPYFNKISIVFYYLFLILFIKLKKKRYLFLILFILLFLKIKPMFNRNTILYFLDVGQGDSLFIRTKNNKSIMVDTGGKLTYKKEKWELKNRNFDIEKNTIIPFIKSIGINKIDYLFLTHGDYDHMGETINLVNNFKVEKVIFNCGEFNQLEQALIKVLDKKKIKYYSCIKELNIDNNKLYFLQTKEYDNENDNSSVIYTELNGYKFMFMGDAGIEKEKDILEKYNISNIDVLKVGHHGSKTSSSKIFIDEIEPKYSIISVGKNNRYGHPNKEVLNILDESKIYRTDQDGSIMFKIKNDKLEIETCSP
ncbi:dNA internalization-related competence protein ComEC/Rec2 [Clostridium sp. CAG:1000]|jgi:competence protein ComEC|nr:dNA internalization-related competence protein ComEC/Rec2 [Clostridium sp. CAG:1000]